MNKYQEALKLLKEYRIGKELSIVDKVNYNARLEKIIDILQELVDKETPKKPIIEKHEERVLYSVFTDYIYRCPTCKVALLNKRFCCHKNDCRQAIDWSD